MLSIAALLLLVAQNPPKPADYFPPPEEQGGWRTLLPAEGEPTADDKAKIAEKAGIDWDRLKEAWEFNAQAEGATQLLVIRRGWVAGEWSRGGDRKKAFNIYSSSKAYTSLAFGLLLEDSENGKLPGGKRLTLETKACTGEWIPEALPLPDPRKSEITVRHLLNMAGGLGAENPPSEAPFEWSLGKVEGSPMAKLKGDPGTVFNYSNAGVAHLVLLFNRAAGKDLFPFMKERVFDPIGMKDVDWVKIGGNGKIGPFNQGYSGVLTNAREHARFCTLALHAGAARWRCTRASGRGSGSPPRPTTISPGRARRSSPTTAPSGGSSRATRAAPPISSRPPARGTTTATSSRASTSSSSAWATARSTPPSGSRSSSRRCSPR